MSLSIEAVQAIETVQAKGAAFGVAVGAQGRGVEPARLVESHAQCDGNGMIP